MSSAAFSSKDLKRKRDKKNGQTDIKEIFLLLRDDSIRRCV